MDDVMACATSDKGKDALTFRNNLLIEQCKFILCSVMIQLIIQ